MQTDQDQFSNDDYGDVPALDPLLSNCSTCNFACNASWDEDRSRWLIPRKHMGGATHSGHPQEATVHLRLQREVVLDAENEQLAKDAEETLSRAPTT